LRGDVEDFRLFVPAEALSGTPVVPGGIAPPPIVQRRGRPRICCPPPKAPHSVSGGDPLKKAYEKLEDKNVLVLAYNPKGFIHGPAQPYIVFRYHEGRWVLNLTGEKGIEGATPLPAGAPKITQSQIYDALEKILKENVKGKSFVDIVQTAFTNNITILDDFLMCFDPRIAEFSGDCSPSGGGGGDAGGDAGAAFGAVQRLCASKDMYCVGYRRGSRKKSGKFLTYQFGSSDWKRDRFGRPKAVWKTMDSLRKSGMRRRSRRKTSKAFRNFFSFKNMYLENESHFDRARDVRLLPLPAHAFGFSKCLHNESGLQLYPIGRHAFTKGPHKGVSSTFSEDDVRGVGLAFPRPKLLKRSKGVKLSDFGKMNDLSYVKGWGGGSFLYDAQPRNPMYGGMFPTRMYGMVGAIAPRGDGISPTPQTVPELRNQFVNPLLPRKN